MARIRTIKPEFWSSPHQPADPWCRLLFIALWNWADDYGVGTCNPRELLGFAFPHDESIDLDALHRMLDEMHRAFDVVFYEVAGRHYYAIPSWSKHQKIDRPSKARNPGPDDAESLISSWIGGVSLHPIEPSSSPRWETSAGKGTRNIGTEEPGNDFVVSQVAGATLRRDADVDIDAIGVDDLDVDPPGVVEPVRADVAALLELLDAEIVANGGKPTGQLKRNRDAMRLLLDRDKVRPEQVEKAIRWCQADEFWRSNILSASKLREKYTQLRLQAARSGHTAPQSKTDRARDVLAMGARLQAEEDRKAVTA